MGGTPFRYWSSTTNVGTLANAWTVQFSGGSVATTNKGTANDVFVRAVRGGL
jgi:hypothetical protein